MAQLYADENFPLPVVDELRRLGHNALTMQESGKLELGQSLLPSPPVIPLCQRGSS